MSEFDKCGSNNPKLSNESDGRVNVVRVQRCEMHKVYSVPKGRQRVSVRFETRDRCKTRTRCTEKRNKYSARRTGIEFLARHTQTLPLRSSAKFAPRNKPTEFVQIRIDNRSMCQRSRPQSDRERELGRSRVYLPSTLILRRTIHFISRR